MVGRGGRDLWPHLQVCADSAGANVIIYRKFEAGEDAGKLVVTACRKLNAWTDKLTVYIKVVGNESSDQPAPKKPRTIDAVN